MNVVILILPTYNPTYSFKTRPPTYIPENLGQSHVQLHSLLCINLATTYNHIPLNSAYTYNLTPASSWYLIQILSSSRFYLDLYSLVSSLYPTSSFIFPDTFYFSTYTQLLSSEFCLLYHKKYKITSKPLSHSPNLGFIVASFYKSLYIQHSETRSATGGNSNQSSTMAYPLPPFLTVGKDG